MAYRRFLSSNWYVYWSAESGNDIDNQILAIYHINGLVIHADYPLLEPIQDINKLKEIIRLNCPEACKPAIDDIDEYDWQDLLETIKEWKEDVINRFTVS